MGWKIAKKGCLLSLWLGGLALALLLYLSISLDSLRRLSWRATPCLITTSQVEVASSRRLEWKADYRYRWARQDYTGHDSVSQDESLEGLVDRYRPASETFCYVNPDDPHESYLRPNHNFGPLALYFAGFLLALAISAWRFFGLGREPEHSRAELLLAVLFVGGIVAVLEPRSAIERIWASREPIPARIVSVSALTKQRHGYGFETILSYQAGGRTRYSLQRPNALSSLEMIELHKRFDGQQVEVWLNQADPNDISLTPRPTQVLYDILWILSPMIPFAFSLILFARAHSRALQMIKWVALTLFSIAFVRAVGPAFWSGVQLGRAQMMPSIALGMLILSWLLAWGISRNRD